MHDDNINALCVGNDTDILCAGSTLLETSSVACGGESSVDNPHQSLTHRDRVLTFNNSLQHGDV